MADPWDSDKGSTGIQLPGQHAVTADERAAYSKEMADYKGAEAKDHVQVNPSMEAAHKIGQCYEWSDRDKYLEVAQQQPLNNMDDPKERLKALSFITQNKPGESADATNTCGPSSIIGGAFLAEGPDGLKKIMGAMSKDKITVQMPDYLELKEKLDKKPPELSVADIQKMQGLLMGQLQSDQEKDPALQNDKEIKDMGVGLHTRTMNSFMKGNPDIEKMFKDNGMQIDFMDVDGATDKQGRLAGEHYVLRMKGKGDASDMVYDPMARRGGQVVSWKEGAETYEKARMSTIDPANSNYAN